ncbi:hypothetical protein C8R46DRAFT_1346098 [Mycena filopes]|nr:hypothetical protein C8R46DRAFT_1346098 [Mycena filopes]
MDRVVDEFDTFGPSWTAEDKEADLTTKDSLANATNWQQKSSATHSSPGKIKMVRDIVGATFDLGYRSKMEALRLKEGPIVCEASAATPYPLKTEAPSVPATRPPTYYPEDPASHAQPTQNSVDLEGAATEMDHQDPRRGFLNLPATLQANHAESPHGPKRRHRNELHAANPNRVSTMSMLPPYSESDSRAIRNSGAVQQTSPHPGTNASSVGTSSSKSLPPIPSEESEAEGLDSSTISLDLYMNAREDPDASTVESYVCT